MNWTHIFDNKNFKSFTSIFYKCDMFCNIILSVLFSSCSHFEVNLFFVSINKACWFSKWVNFSLGCTVHVQLWCKWRCQILKPGQLSFLVFWWKGKISSLLASWHVWSTKNVLCKFLVYFKTSQAFKVVCKKI